MDNNLKNSSNASEMVRARLAGKTGKQYWRCLEELADTDEFREFLMDEVPQATRAMDTGIDRRRFMTLAGASFALAGLSGCRWLPQKKIVPYVEQPEDLVISEPLYYASSILQHGVATGVIVTSRDGRPVRIEGNPDHPGSLGGNSSLVQAEILNLYDPDRSQSVINLGEVGSWTDFRNVVRQALRDSKDGSGIRILTGSVTSPTLKSQLDKIRKASPAIQWHQYEPNARHNVNAGAKNAFGEPVNTIYDLTKADVILSLDSDILFDIPGSIRYARDFASRRRIRSASISANQPANTTMNRVYALESGCTVSGAVADHRLAVRAVDIARFASALAQQLGITMTPNKIDLPASISQTWVNTLIADLTAKPGASLVVAGEHQPPIVHSLVHAINAKLGNVGATVKYTKPLEAEPVDQLASIKTLAADMASGAVKALLIIGGNPVYDTPADLNFKQNLPKVPLSVHLAEHEDETSQLVTWHLPQTHMLEAWSDARGYDGSVSIVQPLIQPLYESAKSPHEFLSILSLDAAEQDGYDIVYNFWKSSRSEPDFEKWWQTTLHDGLVKDSAYPTRQPVLNPASITADVAAPNGLELVFRFDPTIDDGRFANNGWMQELPKPLTKLTWDNAAIMSPNTAEKLGFAAHNGIVVADEKMIKITYKGRELKIPVLPTPGHADDSITISFGYGRTHGGKILEETGFNAYSLVTSDEFGIGTGVRADLTVDTYGLVHTRSHHSMEGREIIMESTLDEYLNKNPKFAEIPGITETERVDEEDESGNGSHTSNVPGKTPRASLYDEDDHKYGDKMTPEGLVTSETGAYAYHWGLSIDNNLCIGCNACVTACQSENNIPVVGKDQVRRGREMHWIRIDRYYKGPIENPHTFFEPVPCMHCENAPCEPVCPVAATVHSQEGLNQMIYNRCVGTRYCSNNCPYKVRRFNFYKYIAGQPDPDKLNGNFDSPVLKLIANPEVTVRGRGVMEKCSYCVQRINAARIIAKKEIRPIKDGEIVTACQQSCPTQAIVFGNIADPNSAVSRLKAEPTDYSLMAELNTRPRTTYLAHLRNPNPAITEDTKDEPDTPVME